MAMRESVRSLRVYFIIVGLLVTLSAVAGIRTAEVPASQVLGLISLIFGVGFLIAGIRLSNFLSGSTAFIKILILGNIAYQVLRSALALLAGVGLAALIFPVIYILISWYLLVNVNRLSGEAQAVSSA